MKALISILLILAFVSCNRPERIVSPKNSETPKALQEENLIEEVSSFSKRGDDDLIDELYSEQVNRTTGLKEVETLIDKIREDEVEAIDDFENYTNKSSRFYNSANRHINNLGDSALKATLVALINESERKNSVHSGKLASLVDQIKINSSNISDYRTALKIIVTLPIIEKYQTVNLPKDSLYRRIIGNQQKILLKMKKMIVNPK